MWESAIKIKTYTQSVFVYKHRWIAIHIIVHLVTPTLCHESRLASLVLPQLGSWSSSRLDNPRWPLMTSWLLCWPTLSYLYAWLDTEAESAEDFQRQQKHAYRWDNKNNCFLRWLMRNCTMTTARLEDTENKRIWRLRRIILHGGFLCFKRFHCRTQRNRTWCEKTHGSKTDGLCVCLSWGEKRFHRDQHSRWRRLRLRDSRCSLLAMWGKKNGLNAWSQSSTVLASRLLMSIPSCCATGVTLVPSHCQGAVAITMNCPISLFNSWKAGLVSFVNSLRSRWPTLFTWDAMDTRPGGSKSISTIIQICLRLL